MEISTFNEYQKEAVALKISLKKFQQIFPDADEKIINLMAVVYDGLGLGEAGEVQGKIKKIIRDNGGIITPEATEEIKSELGDTLWYITSMCENLGITLEDVAVANIQKLHDRRKRGVLGGSGDHR
jgi:NTP pyrophosphatase (non-canonical NTP hydrolase)